VLRDITAGNNDVGTLLAGGKPLGCCFAREGFDRATGLGSPNIPALADRALRAGD